MVFAGIVLRETRRSRREQQEAAAGAAGAAAAAAESVDSKIQRFILGVWYTGRNRSCRGKEEKTY